MGLQAEFEIEKFPKFMYLLWGFDSLPIKGDGNLGDWTGGFNIFWIQVSFQFYPTSASVNFTSSESELKQHIFPCQQHKQ